jgi:hypothetical protein
MQTRAERSLRRARLYDYSPTGAPTIGHPGGYKPIEVVPGNVDAVASRWHVTVDIIDKPPPEPDVIIWGLSGDMGIMGGDRLSGQETGLDQAVTICVDAGYPRRLGGKISGPIHGGLYANAVRCQGMQRLWSTLEDAAAEDAYDAAVLSGTDEDRLKYVVAMHDALRTKLTDLGL